MKLTKDEARILAQAIREFKYSQDTLLYSDLNEKLTIKLNQLARRLEEFGKDKRRNGRTSQDDWTDMLKRYAKNRTNPSLQKNVPCTQPLSEIVKQQVYIRNRYIKQLQKIPKTRNNRKYDAFSEIQAQQGDDQALSGVSAGMRNRPRPVETDR